MDSFFRYFKWREGSDTIDGNERSEQKMIFFTSIAMVCVITIVLLLLIINTKNTFVLHSIG